MDELLLGVGALVVLVIVISLIVKILKSISPMSKEESFQHEINKYAAGSDEERAYALGKSAKESAKKGGCAGWFMFLVIIIIIALLIAANI